MKILKLDHELAQSIARGEKRSTWRLFDDKNIRVGDEIELVDKVDPKDKNSWQVIGVATINRVVEVRLGQVKGEDADGHDTYGASDEDILATFRRYYGPDVTLDTPAKVLQFDFTPLEHVTAFEQPVEPSPTPEQLHEIKLYADGGSRGNPGPSASGYVLMDMHDKILLDAGVYLGITTNNQAEYLALKYGLEEALKRNARLVHVFMDSLLVVNQMKKIYKVKNRDLWPMHEAIVELLPKFEKVSFTHVPREFNRLADAAVNRALDNELSSEPA